MEQQEVEEDEEDLPGWGHWALPQDQMEIDHELHNGEFLELNDLMAPLQEDLNHVAQDELPEGEDNSGLTLSLVGSHNSAASNESANGP